MGTEKETILQIIGWLQNYIKNRLHQAEPSQIILLEYGSHLRSGMMEPEVSLYLVAARGPAWASHYH